MSDAYLRLFYQCCGYLHSIGVLPVSINMESGHSRPSGQNGIFVLFACIVFYLCKGITVVLKGRKRCRLRSLRPRRSLQYLLGVRNNSKQQIDAIISTMRDLERIEVMANTCKFVT